MAVKTRFPHRFVQSASRPVDRKPAGAGIEDEGNEVLHLRVPRTGDVHHRTLATPEPDSQEELDRLGRSLTHELGGLTWPEMRDRVLLRLSEERAAYDRLMARSLELGRKA